MFKRNGSAFRVFFTEAEVWAIRESLADLVCSRCKQKYRAHRDADHFFEYVDDLDTTEAD
jgi:hypothetical protein